MHELVDQALPLELFQATAIHLDPERPSAITANFELVRTSQLLTLTPDAPSDWMMALRSASEDLDNLQLHKLAVGQIITASFSLSKLMITGKCTDRSKAKASKKGTDIGLDDMGMLDLKGGGSENSACTAASLELQRVSAPGSPERPHDVQVSETLVIDGSYFQLQSSPGLWMMSLTARSSMLRLSAAKQTTSHRLRSSTSRGIAVPLLSYAGVVVDVDVTPRKKNVKAVAHPAISASEEGNADGTVHIFSLASGSLYERFLRIMMRSASERSSQPLKFWLLGNFLSPKFRDSIESGALADIIGAEVATVQYSWPAHLRYQTEKQRLIWGYKILFLDVLFPPSVQKIMYAFPGCSSIA